MGHLAVSTRIYTHIEMLKHKIQAGLGTHKSSRSLLSVFSIYQSAWRIKTQTMVPAAEAIRGHKSAHSLATGPVTAEPFISPLGFTITPALSSK